MNVPYRIVGRGESNLMRGGRRAFIEGRKFDENPFRKIFPVERGHWEAGWIAQSKEKGKTKVVG